MTDYTGSNTPSEHRDSWRTPPEIFAALNAEFIFQLDAAATEQNRLCRLFISEQENTLSHHGRRRWAMHTDMYG
jgi:phage N-6-adenine-methyltransferase